MPERESTSEELSLAEIYAIAKDPIDCTIRFLVIGLLVFAAWLIVLQGPWKIEPWQRTMWSILSQMLLFIALAAISGVGGLLLGYFSSGYTLLWNLLTLTLQITYCLLILTDERLEAVIVSALSLFESLSILLLSTALVPVHADSLLRYHKEPSHEEQTAWSFSFVYFSSVAIGVLIFAAQLPLLGAL